MLRHGLSIAFALLTPATANAAARLPADEQQCLEAAARRYSLPPLLLSAIRRQEGGQAGYWHYNRDGSFDYGAMQINSRWLSKLGARGYTAKALVYNSCANITAGAWILAEQLAAHRSWGIIDADPRTYWAGVGDYHSHTPALNRSYAVRIWRRYLLLAEPQP
ncbi:MAG: lytic transglycosylase domain-containing protein [Nevskia sp.]|nr:lytic transglycosylase domain-containing protein [Nevskia sp.]